MNADDSNGARFHVGSTIAGRYRVERPIGEGAMGAVALARHVSLDETVAIKFLRPELRRDPVATARLAREAKALARIKSDHVARVLDVGVTLSVGPYMVMEYLEGVDLGQVLETEGPLPVERAVECVLQVCEALTVAHTAGITHRDIKPENLFLARHGRFETLKILDFGIAEEAPGTGPLSSAELLPPSAPSAQPQSCPEPEADAAGPASSSSGPPSGVSPSFADGAALRRATSPVYGTPPYMAPERVRDDPDADHRSDIWSVGVVLHELVTGRVVFDADSIAETCARIVSDEAIALEADEKVLPPTLRAIIARCLERDPTRRYQSVEELAAALAPLATMHERFRGRSTGAFSRRLLEEQLAMRQASAPESAAAAPPGTWQHVAVGLRAWGARLWQSALPGYVGMALASAMLASLGVWLASMRWMAPPPAAVPLRPEPTTSARGAGREVIVESVLPLAAPSASEPASAPSASSREAEGALAPASAKSRPEQPASAARPRAAAPRPASSRGAERAPELRPKADPARKERAPKTRPAAPAVRRDAASPPPNGTATHGTTDRSVLDRTKKAP